MTYWLMALATAMGLTLLAIPGRVTMADRLVIAYVAQVILLNPVLTTIGSTKVYANTVCLLVLVPIQLARTLDARSRSFLRTSGALTFFLVSTIGLATILPSLGSNGLANAGRLIFLPLSVIAIVPSWRAFPQIFAVVIIALVVRCTTLLVHFFSTLVNIVNRISPDGLGGANAFGMLLALVLLMALQFGRRRIILLIASPVLVLTLLYTYSRGAVVSLLVGVGVWLVLEREAPLGRKIAVVSSALLGTLLLGNNLLQRFTSLGLQQGSGRTVIFRRALDGYASSPIWGHGFGTFTSGFSTGVVSAHNVYLQILYESGLIGFLAALTVCYGILKSLDWRTLLPGAAAIVVDGFVDNHFFVVQFTWIVALLFTFCIYREQSSPNTTSLHTSVGCGTANAAPE